MLHLGTFMGIPLQLHWSFALFMGFVVLLQGPLVLVLLIPLFVLVVLHEYGHCAAARYFNVQVDSVTLYPIGGVAQIEFNPTHSTQEIIIALAGPAVNIVIGILAVIGAYVAYLLQEPNAFIVSVILLYMNLALLVFNMLPIFPMDGGRVLRGVLVKIIGFERATWWAVRSGQVMCMIGIVVMACLGNLLGVLIFFIMVGASQQELLYAQQYACLQRIKDKLAEGLDRPELRTASLSEVLEILEDVRDDELRQRFYYDELVPLLKEMDDTVESGR